MSASGRVLQVNVSPGGVPKLPVAAAYVDRFGLQGDAHHDVTSHGGPHRAVTLYAIEAIRRVAKDGHPIFAGSCGENLTTEGIELSQLPVGTRLAIGEELLLELAKPDNPCKTIAASFIDGRFARISIKVHPDDSRMYARVLREGLVRPGDPIAVLPPAADSVAAAHVLMERVDAAKRMSDLARWRAAEAAGMAIEIVDDEELAMAASPEIPGPAFNRALGLGALPQLLPRALDLFREVAVRGWLPMDERPWPDAEPTIVVDTHVAPVDLVIDAGADSAPVDGLQVAAVEADDLGDWVEVMVAVSDLGGAPADVWRRVTPHLQDVPGHHLVIARLHGVPVGVGLVAIRKGTGLLRSAGVLPEARGLGIQRALITARAAIARDHGADIVAAGTGPESPASADNLERLGFERIWSRAHYRFDPAEELGQAGRPARGDVGALGAASA
ncbi:MAG TPA: GNAT family N-acetyltransferase [Candidatus Dormibacteraeota bacterium]|nr:GNAT family N-acetyltransferase [Candidatus Dormibacteraeota bacterium]